MKTLKGEKYIYALMALRMCQELHKSHEYLKIGNDSGVKNGYQFERIFKLVDSDGKHYIAEKKSSPHMADFTRYYEYHQYENNIVVYEPTQWEH